MTNQEQQQAQSARVAAQNKSNSATATSAPAPQATQVASAVKIELSDQLPIGQQQQPTAPTAQTNTHQNHNNHHNHHTHNHHNNHQAPNCCASCLMPIKDRFIFNVINQNFHQECVRCADCSVGLNEKCFTQDGKLYCRLDYWRRFGPKCSACSESIEPTEFVQKLKQDLIYHLSCFVCQDCKRHLQAGEQLHLLADNKILCKRDFLNSHQLNNHQLHHQNNSHQHHNNQTSTTSNQQANASTTTTNTTTATTTTTTTASNHHHHQRIKSATNTTNTSSTTSPNGQSDINAQSSQPNCNNIQENQSQYHHEEGLNNPGGGGANNPGAELQLASQELSKSASATTLDGGLADNEHNNNNNNSNHNEPDEDEPDELDEDGASSIGANDHLDQFQTGPPAGVPNFTTSGRAQQKGSSAGSGAGAGAGGGAGIKFDPADCNDDLVDANGKRRGPRTTIKPKQLETLRRAFESAPKPSRHIREQLAAETGLNMRVIQVWFQNRRSKERRMRNSNGSARRNFFRSSSRRLRVGPQPQQTPLASQTATPGGAPTGPQANTGGGSGPVNGASSLIAATTAGPKERASKLTKGGSQVVQGQLRNTPPLDKTGGGGAGPGGANNTKSNQSPSDFGGSSTGGSCGFTYFSDSSNQGNESSFAVMASLSAASSVANQQYSQGASSNGILQQQSPPESVGNMTPTGGAAANATNTTGLISLESPSGVGSQHSNGAGVSSGAAANGNTNNPAANQQQQQQYQSSPMKNTPPPQIYQQQQQQQPQLINHQQHLIGAPQQQHHHMMQHMNNSHHQHHQQQQQHHNQHQHHHHQQQQQQQQHQHQQHHDHHHLHHAHHRLQIGGLPSHHMVQPGPGMMGPGGGMPAGLMQAHPSQAGPPSVVQW